MIAHLADYISDLQIRAQAWRNMALTARQYAARSESTDVQLSASQLVEAERCDARAEGFEWLIRDLRAAGPVMEMLR